MSKSKKINVDKEKLNDISYRYKMSEVSLKDEGFGNGLRTVFLNLEEVSNDLMRDPIMIISYLTSVLGCKYIAEKNEKDKENIKWILYGKYTQDTIQMYIYEFVDRFVLCRHCRNPETKFRSEKKYNVVLSCAACSKSSDIVDNKHTMKVLKLVRS